MYFLIEKFALIANLKFFQLARSPSLQYLVRLLVQFWFHYSFEYLVMHLGLECLVYAFSYTEVS